MKIKFLKTVYTSIIRDRDVMLENGFKESNHCLFKFKKNEMYDWKIEKQTKSCIYFNTLDFGLMRSAFPDCIQLENETLSIGPISVNSIIEIH